MIENLKHYQSLNRIIKNLINLDPLKIKENRVIFISDELAKELFKLKNLQNSNKIVNAISIIILTIISSVMSLVNITTFNNS